MDLPVTAGATIPPILPVKSWRLPETGVVGAEAADVMIVGGTKPEVGSARDVVSLEVEGLTEEDEGRAEDDEGGVEDETGRLDDEPTGREVVTEVEVEDVTMGGGDVLAMVGTATDPPDLLQVRCAMLYGAMMLTRGG